MIEVNEYVRTTNGKIAKYIGYNKELELHMFDKGIKWHYEYYTDIFEEDEFNEFINEDIVKHSKQLIDLIENKDILKVRIDKTTMFFGIDESTSDTKYKEIIKSIENGECELLEILTHQQFEANCYKVGGEDE